MSDPRVNRLRITTTEGIAFTHRLAGPVTRFCAWAIDFAVILTILILLSIATAAVGMVSAGLGMSLTIFTYFAVSIGYGIVTEWFWRGQTLGKRVLGLRVLDVQGLSIHFSQIVLRNLFRFLDSIPVFYLVGGIALLCNRHNQRLGDLAANTVVVRLQRTTEPNLDELLPGKFNSFRAYPHLEARLRQQVSPELAAILVQALVRRDELEDAARVALFRETAQLLRELVSFPEDATMGLSDEQYVRNAVESLYRKRARSSHAIPAAPEPATPDR